MSKLSKLTLCCFVIRSRRIFFMDKVSKMHVPIIPTNGRSPSPVSFVPRNAFEARAIFGAEARICMILGWRGLTEIISSVVQGVMVYVVSFLALCAAEYQSRHKNSASILFRDSVETSDGFSPMGVPIPLTKPREILSVNDGVLPLRERNQAVGCIKWLRNEMPFYPAFRHVVLHQRTLCNAAILA